MQRESVVFAPRTGSGNRAVRRHGRHRAGTERGVAFVVLNLAQRIEQVQSRIAAAADRAGRSFDEVTLIAVSKTVDRIIVDEAYALGLREFGENRVQDSIAKYAAPLPEDARLHMI